MRQNDPINKITPEEREWIDNFEDGDNMTLFEYGEDHVRNVAKNSGSFISKEQMKETEDKMIIPSEQAYWEALNSIQDIDNILQLQGLQLEIENKLRIMRQAKQDAENREILRLAKNNNERLREI